MEMSLILKNNECLTTEERKDIDKQIDKIIEQHKGNSFEINRLVFDSVTALTVSEARANELADQGMVKRFWGGLTGKNQKLQSEIDNGLARAQYASQQTLQKLAEQNLMSFELITTVNNKLNSSIIEIESEINKIYGTLVTFFRQTKSDIIQIENRVERLERNVNLLNWQNSIEYQMYNGIEYNKLTNVEKIVCIVRDFYGITKGEWTTSDLLLLKAAMNEVGLFPKSQISYINFISEVCENKGLLSYLLGEEFHSATIEPQFATILSCIHKVNNLENDEKYIVQSIKKLLAVNNVDQSANEIAYSLMSEYIEQKTSININTMVNMYDLIIELLFNCRQFKEYKYIETLPEKMKLAEKYFINYKMKEAFPLLCELSAYGYLRAKYLLALIYEEGYDGLEKNNEQKVQLAKEAYEEGDEVAAIYYALFCSNSDEEKNNIYLKYKHLIAKLAESGNVFAQYELGRCYINETDESINYEKAVFWFDKSMKGGFFRAYFSIAKRYDYGQFVEKDYNKSFEYYMKSARLGFMISQHEVGRCFENGWGIEKNIKKALEWYGKAAEQNYGEACRAIGYCMTFTHEVKDYEVAFKYFKKAAELGNVVAINDIGVAYENGRGVVQDNTKAVEWYKRAAEQGEQFAQCNLGFMYLWGRGISKDLNKAKEWFEKSSDQGHQRAIDALRDNF